MKNRGEKVSAKLGGNDLEVVDLRNGKYDIRGVPKKSGDFPVSVFINQQEQVDQSFYIIVLPGI